MLLWHSLIHDFSIWGQYLFFILYLVYVIKYFIYLFMLYDTMLFHYKIKILSLFFIYIYIHIFYVILSCLSIDILLY